MSDIPELWQRLTEWAENNAPDILAKLDPPATEAEIAEVESELGVTLPASFRDCLRVHNGESDGWPCRIFADRGAFLSTQRIIDEWESRRSAACEGDDPEDPERLIRDGIISVSGPVKPVLFSDSWVPIMECNGDVFWALDFDPAETGVAGQLIEVDWEGCSWKVVSNSFGDFFARYIESLEAGLFLIIDGRPTEDLTQTQGLGRFTDGNDA